MSTSASIVRSKSEERRWIVYISEIIEKELKDRTNISCAVFCVPKLLSAAKPEDYSPQFVALGPYHHFTQHLYEMERYKLTVAKQMHGRFQSIGFNEFVARLSELELDIRSCYHRHLDIDGDTLAWIMAIDGLFLLELLYSQVSTHNILRPLNDIACQLVLARGKKLTHDSLFRDIIKLENQIPFFVLREILVIECPNTSEIINKFLPSTLVAFCKEISPLYLKEQDYSNAQPLEHAHILDLLYHMILPEKMECFEVQKEQTKSSNFIQTSGYPMKIFSSLWKMILNVNVGILKNFKRIFRLIESLMKILPVVGYLVSSTQSGDDINRSEDSIEDKAPLMEAGIMVPTASQLFDAGVNFQPTASIKTIKFDPKTVTFFLPAIQLGANSEVILRNLVAYEAMAMADSLVFARYLHLMNSFIDTAEDVKLLRDKKIIISRMKKDQEMANLFNGMMNNSIGLTPARDIDVAIKGVSTYYERVPKVRAYKIVKKYIYSSWKILTLLATLLLLGLLVLQSFCSIYSCPQMFHTIETTGV